METEGTQNIHRVNSVFLPQMEPGWGLGWERNSSVFVMTAPISTEHFLWAFTDITSFTQGLWSPVRSPGTVHAEGQKDRQLSWHRWGQGGDSCCHPHSRLQNRREM